MSISGTSGPLVIFGQNPAQAGTNYQPDYNGDQGPSGFVQGTLLLDPRYGFRAPLQAGTLSAVGYYQSSDLLVIDEAPATKSTASIAALANVTNNTPMTLVTTSGSGIIVSSTSNVIDTKNGSSVTNTTGIVTMPVSGIVLPLGTLFVNSTPSFIYFGQNGPVAVQDPRSALTRVVSITGVASGTGGTFAVRGWDGHGYPLTENIVVGAGVNTVLGKRGFKAIKSVTPLFTDAHTYSVGLDDVFEFPLMVTSFSQVEIFWANAGITANTGFLTGVATTMTAINGSVRGTYAVQSAANGTNVLQVFINPAPYNVGQINGVNSLFGQAQFSN